MAPSHADSFGCIGLQSKGPGLRFLPTLVTLLWTICFVSSNENLNLSLEFCLPSFFWGSGRYLRQSPNYVHGYRAGN